MKFKFSILLSIIYCAMQSQNGVVVSGGNATGNSGTSSYSIGQVFYKIETGPVNYIVQGLQQPLEISVLSDESNDQVMAQMTAYPNPVSSDLTLELPVIDKEMYFEIYDTNGRTISKMSKITNSRTNIPMDVLQPGLYFLKISDQNNAVKIFKILKK